MKITILQLAADAQSGKHRSKKPSWTPYNLNKNRALGWFMAEGIKEIIDLFSLLHVSIKKRKSRIYTLYTFKYRQTSNLPWLTPFLEINT